MPRHRGPGMVPEKSKDFFGSFKRILINLKPWKILMTLALLLAVSSAVIALITPNRLSDLVDEVSNGIKPKTEYFEIVGTKIGENFTQETIAKKIPAILTNQKISLKDKNILNTTIRNLSTNLNEESIKQAIIDLPESILAELVDPIKIDGVTISKKDQAKFLKTDFTNAEGLETIDNLPKSIYSLVVPKMNRDKILSLSIILGSLYLASALFGYIQNLSLTTVSNKFAKKLRTNISVKINKLKLKFFDTHETGDILSRVTNDVDMIGHTLNQSLATLVTSLTLFIGSIIMMFYTNWILALTAIASSIIGFVFMGMILKRSQKYFSLKQKQLGELNGHIEEMYSGHIVVKAYNGEKESINRFKELNDRLFESNRKSQFLSGLMFPIMGFVGNLGYVAVCVVGALLTMNGYISFGVIIAFTIYVRLFTNPLSQMAQAMTQLQSTVAASERVFEFLDEEEMTDEKKLVGSLDINNVKGAIDFVNVKFGYNDDKIIIKNFSASVNPGNKIAIVGPTGAGKTTMVNLLMKFYEINDGDILIDGVSIKDLPRENIHELFCMVLQDTWLFEGTVLDNIRFNNQDITEEEVWDICKTVGVEHFIKTLPGGLHSVIDDGDSISSGEKQLLTICRGMTEKAPFLILDEATSNVDTRTEELVQKAMDKLTEGRTSFIIAHRLSTIKNADLILVMKDGNIIESGNHDELIRQNGFYKELYNSQFEEVE